MSSKFGPPHTVVYDVDGTLSDPEHRRQYVAVKPKNWPAFERGMKDDPPQQDIIWLLQLMQTAGVTILIATGRSEDNRAVTEAWLAEHGITYAKLYMRSKKDYRSDDIVKSEILDQMLADGYNPTMAVDDRNQVVAEWRRRGLRCLQVQPGDF